MLFRSVLMLLASTWQLRALYTIEFTRQRAVNSHREWLTAVGFAAITRVPLAEGLSLMTAHKPA